MPGSTLHAVSFLLCLASALINTVHAADKDQWRSRAIYQLLTDRFAPPSDTAPALTSPLPTNCDPGLQTWCGGTWLSIIDKLPYIQQMGFDAIWISPTSQNIDVQTPYNFAYHGYWVNDPTKLNPRFGSADDLKALSAALHARGMYLMVDIVVNNVASLSNKTDADTLNSEPVLWKDPAQYHTPCPIDYNNMTSVEQCWMSDDKLFLMDVDTELPAVQTTLQQWIGNFTKEFGVDGLRIDAAKHVDLDFWPGFCGAAGVFCIGEVYGNDVPYASSFQTKNYMDSVLNYPLYNGIADAFTYPGSRNMSSLVNYIGQIQSSFNDTGVLGNFIENHDLPRFRNITVDPMITYNAMVLQFMMDGIPIVYYGQEQELSNGAADPYNREALFADGNGGYANTTTVARIRRLNQIRQALIVNATIFDSPDTFLGSKAQILMSDDLDIAFKKGPALVILNSRGSPSEPESVTVKGLDWSGTIVDVILCSTTTLGSDKSVKVSYSKPGQGGRPYIFLPLQDAIKSGLCPGLAAANSYTPSNTTATLQSAGLTTAQVGSQALGLALGAAALASLI